MVSNAQEEENRRNIYLIGGEAGQSQVKGTSFHTDNTIIHEVWVDAQKLGIQDSLKSEAIRLES